MWKIARCRGKEGSGGNYIICLELAYITSVPNSLPGPSQGPIQPQRGQEAQANYGREPGLFSVQRMLPPHFVGKIINGQVLYCWKVLFIKVYWGFLGIRANVNSSKISTLLWFNSLKGTYLEVIKLTGMDIFPWSYRKHWPRAFWDEAWHCTWLQARSQFS